MSAAETKENAKTPLSLRSGHSSMQGVRPSMEDEVLIKENFRLSQPSPHLPGALSFYAVFDGHGGRQAAIYTRDHLFSIFVQELEKGQPAEDALRKAFLETDEQFIAACRGEEKEAAAAAGGDKEEHIQKEDKSAASSSSSSSPPTISVPSSSSALEKDTSGTTAVAILICHATRTLYVAHVGDSRAVLLSSAGSSSIVLSLTSDHKADRPDEVERIRAAGGFVVHKRVMGELAISRAIGDVDFKQTGFLFVLADPEVAVRELREEEDILVLACDGLYDVMTNEKVAEYVREAFKEGKSEQEVAESIVKHAIDKLFTRDNVTAIVVRMTDPAHPPTEPSLHHHAAAHHHAQHGHHAAAATHSHAHPHAHHHGQQHGHHEAAQQLSTGGVEVGQARSVPPLVPVAGEEPVAEVVMQEPHS